MSKIPTLAANAEPIATDHRLARNPCQSLRGLPRKQEISKVSDLAGLMGIMTVLVCVCDSCT